MHTLCWRLLGMQALHKHGSMLCRRRARSRVKPVCVSVVACGDALRRAGRHLVARGKCMGAGVMVVCVGLCSLA
jgi:hypothetical protein